ncbi:protein AF-10 isoform X7 [Phlebotomus papatasi]|uniref:protein AF-10 isoform X7 n=1 Tax=Phlebotomus papatasi TaxID=29031 RepID=UPI0024840988|nr:protein AF-10 isoform X7 [Phlebotomus papatasi]
MKEMVGGCCVCSDERGWPENPLVYCDGQNCTVAVHQACYGIVTVPTGPWYCRKCESQERSARVRCELCPSRDGALKKTDNASWAHVVCALYIPEVRFGNVTTMEPIILQLIPAERYAKNCYICQEMGKGSRANVGACMQCNKTGCRMQFHVTCAQALGLLCEEAGNYLDNVKYCGYCQYHYSKLKKGGNVKTIPPYKPIQHEAGSSDSPSSPEKDSEAATTATGATAGAPAPKPGTAQPSTATISASALPAAAAATSSKQRKSSSSTKGVSGPAAATAAAPTAVAATVVPQMAPAVAAAATTPPVASGSATGTPAASKMGSSGGGSGKEKEKHSRGANKMSSSKDKESFREKNKSSSKAKEDFAMGAMGKASVATMEKTGVLVSTPSATATKSSSIIAPSVLQGSKELMTKDASGKFTTSNFTESVVVNSESVFGSDNSKGSTSSTSSNVAKKRKADGKSNSVEDVNNSAYLSFCRDLIKDVSVTLIPLSSVDKLDLGEVKKVRTESTASSSPALQTPTDGPLGSTLLTTGPATLSLPKQHVLASNQPMPVQATASIIKPPVIKDVGDLGRVQAASSPFAAATPAEMQPSTTTQSIRVSVPLSTASVAGINLPTNNNTSSSSPGMLSGNIPSTSTAGSLFQQALHNRSAEQMGSFTMGRLGNPQQSQRASPIVQMPPNHQNVILQHQGMQERQSPLVQQAASSPLLAHPPEQASTPASGAATQMQNLSPIGIHSQILTSGNVAAVHQSDSGMLKITYEKQPPPRATPTPVQEDPPNLPGRRSRTPETTVNFASAVSGGGSSFAGLKFTYESQPSTSSTVAASSSLPPKDSPPSSPGSEAGASTRKRSRKAAAAAAATVAAASNPSQVESKELKIFQNGIHVTHMLGNQLNPASSVAQKMSDQLHMEIEAHSVYTSPAMDTSPQLVGPPFPGKHTPYSSSKAAATQGPPSLTTMLGAGSGSSSGSGTTPQSLEQLLERQWEQGSQFLMEQAQHFDIASLLSCLHQLQTENVRLEEHVNNLVARRDHLLAVNARLAIPLANPNAATGQVQFNSMNVNGPSEATAAAAGRTSRSSASGQPFSVQPTVQQTPAQPSQPQLQQIPVENGVDFRHSAVSAVTITPHQPPSGGSVRHSPVTQQPFVGQAAAGGRQTATASGSDSSRSRCAAGAPTAGSASVFQAQQTTSSYQKLALLQQQQQQAQTIRRDDGQAKPS